MPPKSAGKAPASTATPPPPADDELVQRLEVTEAQLGLSRDKLQRLASTSAALDSERAALGGQLNAERAKFSDITAHLQGALAAAVARSDGLEAALAEARAALAAAQAAAAEAAAQAEERRAADVGAKQEELAGQAERVRQAEEFLAERDSLRARTVAAEAAAEEDSRRHHTRMMDLERKHASDRELWRRDAAEAVRAARAEMAAAADQRLDATTQQTICDNEAMAGELQYQGRHVQGLLTRNSDLQKEVNELRLALDICRRSEAELVKKALACEKTVETLLARLGALEAAAGERAAAVAHLSEQLADSWAEVHAAGLQLDDKAAQVALLEDKVEKKRRELRTLRASLSDAANFLMQCLSDAKQDLLGEQGRAALAAAAPEGLMEQLAAAPGSPPVGACTGQSAAVPPAARRCASPQPGGSPAAAAPAPATTPLLAELPPPARQELLQRLLDRLGVDWQEQQGLVLPASGSPSAASSLFSWRGAASPRSHRSAAAVCGDALPGKLGRGGAPCDGDSEVLMKQLRSDVRPWGESKDRAGAGVEAAQARRTAACPPGGSRTSRQAPGTRSPVAS